MWHQTLKLTINVHVLLGSMAYHKSTERIQNALKRWTYINTCTLKVLKIVGILYRTLLKKTVSQY